VTGFLQRLNARWRMLRRHNAELNRRVEIENVLAMMAQGKRPLPTREQCRIMALRLGTPKELWGEDWKL
jgi:hypothetical protein